MKLNTYAVQITCPNCNKKSTYTIHSLIDTTLDKNAEQKLFSGTLFTYTCPFCKEEIDLSHSCMYHDGSKQLLIALADNKTDEEEMILRLNGNYHENELDEVLHDWVQNCKRRIVSTPNQLQEKVLISHFNLDDHIIEIAKQFTKDIASEQEPTLNIDELLFNHNQEGYSFVIFDEEGVVGETPFSKDTYLMLEKKYGSKIEDNSLFVDEEWAKDFLRRTTVLS